MRIKSFQSSTSKYMIFLDLLLAWISAFILSRTNRQSISMPVTIVVMVLWLGYVVFRYPQMEMISQKFTLSFFAFEGFVLIVCGCYFGPLTAFNNVLSQVATFGGIFLFYLYSEQFPRKRFQILLTGILGFFLLQNIDLFLLCGRLPDIGRMIVSGETYDSISASVANPYSIAQADCLMVIAICRILCSRKFSVNLIPKLLLILFVAALAMTVYRIQSTITTLIMILGSICAVGMGLFERKKKRKEGKYAVTWLLLALLLIFALFNKERIGALIIKIFSDGHTYFAKRLTEVGKALAYNELSGDIRARIRLLTVSVDAFIKYPLIGTLYTAADLSGRHSALLDMFARYGLLGGVPQLMIFIFYFKWLKKKLPSFDHFLWVPLLIASILNPLSLYQTYFAAFFIAPGIYFAFQKEYEITD